MTDYQIDHKIIRSGFDKAHCYVLARASALPDGTLIMTTHRLLLSCCDECEPLESMVSTDGGATWSEPKPEPHCGGEHAFGALTHARHWKTGAQLGIGVTCQKRSLHTSELVWRKTTYSVYDTENMCWKPGRTLQMPAEERFVDCGADASQWVELPDGDILLPFHFTVDGVSSSAVMRCAFDGEVLTYLAHGNELCADENARGLCEPSLACYRGKYYLTLRADHNGYVAVSDDGLHYRQPALWRWDDGTVLPNYNTQQHWICHSGGLFLAYTRRGADNGHVFRHRAPLFMAQVDPDTMRVVRASERILVPERGARLGNFGVTHISPTQALVTVNEWMQQMDYDKCEADNAFWVSRITWGQANEYFQ